MSSAGRGADVVEIGAEAAVMSVVSVLADDRASILRRQIEIAIEVVSVSPDDRDAAGVGAAGRYGGDEIRRPSRRRRR
jgi:hypothetical protein